MSVVRIREGPYYRGFFKKKYMRILSVHGKLSIIERCPHGEVRLYVCMYVCMYQHVHCTSSWSAVTTTLNSHHICRPSVTFSQLFYTCETCFKPVKLFVSRSPSGPGSGGGGGGGFVRTPPAYGPDVVSCWIDKQM